MPALPSDKELFSLALRVLETTAVPLMVKFPPWIQEKPQAVLRSSHHHHQTLLSRYEKSGMYASVLSVDLPFSLISASVASQKLQSELEAKGDMGISSTPVPFSLARLYQLCVEMRAMDRHVPRRWRGRNRKGSGPCGGATISLMNSTADSPCIFLTSAARAWTVLALYRRRSRNSHTHDLALRS